MGVTRLANSCGGCSLPLVAVDHCAIAPAAAGTGLSFWVVEAGVKMDIKSPQEVFELTNGEYFLSRIADLAVAYVEPEARESEGVTASVEDLRAFLIEEIPEWDFDLDGLLSDLCQPGSGESWRRRVDEVLHEHSPERRFLWLADNCIDSYLLEDTLLASGTYMRRLDAVLDVAEAPFCASDVQGAFVELASDIADAKVTWAHTGGVMAGSFALGAAGGFFMVPGATFAGGKFAEYFLNRIGGVDDIAVDLARLLILARAATDGSGGSIEARTLRRYLLSEVAVDCQNISMKRRRIARGTQVD